MINKLHIVFSTYAASASHRLSPHDNESKIKVIRNRRQLLDLVEELEGASEFMNLVTDTLEHFSKETHTTNEDVWRHAVQNFFRRSACYLDIFDGREALSESLFEKYVEAFTKTETTIQYLAPLEFLDFSRFDMEFNGFQIRYFRRDELGNLLGSRINDVFYRWASLASADLDLLQQYWFLCASETVPNNALDPMHFDFNLNEFDKVRTEHQSFPVPIESSLKKLVLFDWEAGFHLDKSRKEGLNRGWYPFGLPFAIRIDDNLLAQPSRMPSLDGLVTQPKFDPAGEEIGIEPVPYLHLDKKETVDFCKLISHVENLLEKLPPGEWKFIDIALNFIRKAFFSEGIDQLLWHIAAIDALVGEREGGTKRLRRRLGMILAEDSTERENVEDQFKELYHFRNALVHGDVFPDTIYVGHLRRARDFAIGALLWFLNFLNSVQSAMPEITLDGVKRDDILNQIDTSDERLQMLERSIRISRTLKQNFENFPYVKDWIPG